MATTTQTVIIDFQSDFSSVQDAVDILEKAGKVDAALAAEFKKTNTEIKKQGDALDKTAMSAERESQKLKRLSDLMASFPRTGLNRFLLQVGNELAKAGVSADLFFKKAKEGNELIAPKFDSLKLQLAAVKKRMEEAAKTSGTLSKEYIALREQAGALSNAIKDINSDVANTGSDTKNIDNIVGSISALSGGYSALAGATALFGNESEDVQKALLKVNAAMALATGLQQIQNATTKTGSLTRLADTAATYTQIAANKIYTAVTGRATAATVGFKIALAATGIGLVILAFVAFSQILKKNTSDLDEATAAIERQNKALESTNELLARRLDREVAAAQLAGKSEADLIRIRGIGLQQQIEAVEISNKKLVSQRDALDKTSEAWFLLNAEIGKNKEVLIGLNNDVLIASLNLQKQAIEDNRKALDERERRALAGAKNDLQRFNIQQSFDRQRLADLRAQGGDIAEIRKKEGDIFVRAREREIMIAKKQRAALLELEKGQIDTRLVTVQKGSIEEFELRKKLLDSERIIALEAENLTSNERKVILQKYLRDKLQLEKDFNKQSLAQANEDEKSRVNALLSNLNLSEEKKLDLTIDFLRLTADAEIQSAEGNAAKIREINAKLNTDIAAAKVASIRKSAEDEARILSADGGAALRALEAVSVNEKMKFDIRINAIRQLSRVEISAIDREIEANRKANDVKGADNRALEIEYKELLDKRAAASEATEKKITDFTKAANLERIQFALAGLEKLGEIAAGIQQNNQQAAENSIALQKRELDDLVKAGAISEKEAERRNKKIEAEERAAKNRAAKQIKALAVFQAFLAIPQAYLAGLQTPIIGAIVGPIYAALAAVQAGIVAARPVPKFYRGKKNNYEGLGIMGDQGAELLQRADGSMHVAKKSEMVYVGAKDIIYTAAETKRILPTVNKEAINHSTRTETFDYNKMARAMKHKDNKTVINIDKDFISESVANGLMKSNYFGKYYKSK